MHTLHVHSDYSNIKYLDSINTVESIVKTSLEMGLNGAALTDHETLSGHLEFLKAVEKVNKKGRELIKQGENTSLTRRMANFKGILGNEVYLTREGLERQTYEKGDRFYHFLLLAKDKKGWEQLNELSSIAWDRYFVRGIPRTPLYLSDLKRVVGNESGHIVATTACLGSYLGDMVRKASNGEMQVEEASQKVKDFILELKDLFGDDFYLEIQPGQSQEQIIYNQQLAGLSRKYDVPLVVTTDAHYDRPEWKEVHAAYLNSQEADRETADFYDYTYIMNEKEVRDLLATHLDQDAINEAIQNTDLIGEKIERYDIRLDPIIPKIPFQDEDKWDEKINKFNHKEWFKIFSESEDKQDRFLLYKIIIGIEKMEERGWLRPSLEEVLEAVNGELEAIYKISQKLNQNMSTYFTTFQGIVDKIWEVSVLAPGRGSAGAFMINFLLEITQINPLTQPVPYVPWRFIHPDKASLPDIDIDTGSSKKKEAFALLEEWFKSFNSDLTYIATFGTEKSKSAIITAARGMGLSPEDGRYFASMIPSERGFLWSLHDCYYGNEEKGRKPIETFVQEMNDNPELWKIAQRIEGLINKRGVHPAGIAIFNDGNIYSQTSTMIAPGGQRTIQYDLSSAEEMGVVKYDLLATDAIDGIQTTMILLVEYDFIQFQDSLRETFYEYLHPEVLDYESLEMWERAHNKEIISLFQFSDSPVGEAAMQDVKPTNLLELGTINSVMRLMAADGDVMPIVKYRRHKQNINFWYNEMKQAELNSKEIAILEKHIKNTYGMCITQEQLMIMVQDPQISNFTFLESDKTRKVLAKKKMDQVENIKKLFYKKGAEQGTRVQFLNYIWDNLFAVQMGYSFSMIHTNAYSIIAIQQMNLVNFYPPIFWGSARLMVESGAIDFLAEDLESFEADDSEELANSSVNYFKMSSAIGRIRAAGIKVEPPNINYSNFTFRVDPVEDTIYFGMKGITRIGNGIIKEIISNRPYSGLQDFLNKVKVNKIQATMLIKAGAFDQFGKRSDMLLEYCKIESKPKSRLTMQNMNQLIESDFVPAELKKYSDIWRLNKHLRKNNLYGDLFVFDGKLADIMNILGYVELDQEGEEFFTKVSDWNSFYKSSLPPLQKWIKEEQQTLLERINNKMVQDLYSKYAAGSRAEQEMDALGYYYTNHLLEEPKYQEWLNQLEVADFFKLPEEPVISWENGNARMFELTTIVGTSIGRDKQKNIVGLSTPSGFVKVKVYRAQFIKFDRQIKLNGETEKSWFSKGTNLLIHGYRAGDYFIPKKYKSSPFGQPIYKIEDAGKLRSLRLGENDENSNF